MKQGKLEFDMDEDLKTIVGGVVAIQLIKTIK